MAHYDDMYDEPTPAEVKRPVDELAEEIRRKQRALKDRTMQSLLDQHDAMMSPTVTTNTISIPPKPSTTWHTMARHGPDEIRTRGQEPQTIYPVEGGYVVFPMSLTDTSAYDGSTRSFMMNTILDQMKFFTTLEAATAYLTVHWSGMLEDKHLSGYEPAEAASRTLNLQGS